MPVYKTYQSECHSSPTMAPKSKLKPPNTAAFLRQLKDAAQEPGFRPAAMFSTGLALDKADSIQGFLDKQRKRTGASTAKTEWMLAAQQLQEESVMSEKELLAALQSLTQRQGSAYDSEVVDIASKAAAELQANSLKCQTCTAALRLELKTMHEQLQQHKVSTAFPSGQRQVMEQSLMHLKEHLQQQLLALAEEEGAIDKQDTSSVGQGGEDTVVEDSNANCCLLPDDLHVGAQQAVHSESRAGQAQRDSMQGDDSVWQTTALKQGPRGSCTHPTMQDARQPHACLQQAAAVAALDSEPLCGRPSQHPELAAAGDGDGAGQGDGDGARDGEGVELGAVAGVDVPRSAAQGSTQANDHHQHHHQQQQQQQRQERQSQQHPADTNDVTTSLTRDMALLDEVVLRYPLASDATKARVRMVYYVLRQRYQERVEAWQADSTAAVGAVLKSETSATEDGALDATGGWPADEHSLFVSHRLRCCQGRAGKGRPGGGLGVGAGAGYAGRDALMRQLAALMPNRTMAQLIAHDDWLTTHKLMQRKRRDLLEAWHRERSQFLEDSAALLHEAHAAAGARAAIAADRLTHELAREHRHGKLRDMQEQAAMLDAAAAASMAALEAAAAQQAAIAAAIGAERMAHSKQLISAYRAELQRQLVADAEVSAQTHALAEAARVERATHNQERVQWRKAQYLVKQDKARAIKDQISAEAAAREVRLERLRALVAPEIEVDPCRVLWPTESSLGVDEKTAGPFKDVNGFTTEQVFKDSRVKLMAALQQAGLHNTEYGRQVIQAASTATQTRVDNLTVDQRKL